jgi:AcrR family transcriptional regulator
MSQTDLTVSGDAPKLPRADSRRNRLRVLAAAQDAFESEGIAVSVEAIARRAGVGVGTVYRHFPTKEALFQAIVMTSLEGFVEQARALADAEDPGAALYGYLAQVIDQSETSMAIKDALSGTDFDADERASDTFHELELAVGHLLARAQEAGDARTDVTIGEVFALVGGACRASSALRGDAVSPRRLVSVICDGLRPPVARA